MSNSFVDEIRSCEFELVLGEIRALKNDGCRVLEIGAGTGLQARQFSEAGFEVDAIDLRESSYREARVWPVVDYDGRHIPFDDKTFDVVFSSSVLEHIPHLNEMQQEIRRVLKDDGIAVHVVPGSSWVVMSALTHYPYIVKLAFGALRRKLSGASRNPDEAGAAVPRERYKRFRGKERFMRVLMPPRHGERGIWLHELYYFSKRVWIDGFLRSGWTVRKHLPNGLCYSGNLIFGSMLDIEKRKRLSRILSSVCHVFVLTK